LNVRPLMIVVDECQDLAPLEWQVVLDWSYGRRKKVRPNAREFQTRVAMVGDPNQRVSATPFTWTQVTAYAQEVLGIPRKIILSETIETTSLRITREI
jgi:hypothetical protein